MARIINHRYHAYSSIRPVSCLPFVRRFDSAKSYIRYGYSNDRTESVRWLRIIVYYRRIVLLTFRFATEIYKILCADKIVHSVKSWFIEFPSFSCRIVRSVSGLAFITRFDRGNSCISHGCWMLQEVLDVHRISFIEVLFYFAVALLQKYKTSCADKVFDSVKSQLIQVLSFPRRIDRCFRERYSGNSRKFFTKARVPIGWPIGCRLKGINFVRHLDRSSTNFRRLVSCYPCQVSS